LAEEEKNIFFSNLKNNGMSFFKNFSKTCDVLRSVADQDRYLLIRNFAT
jgi:hypothetical protein